MTIHNYDFSHHECEPIEYKNTCFHCGETNIIITDEPAFLKWYNREMFAQDAFPDLTAEERELIISGTHPECWNKIFA